MEDFNEAVRFDPQDAIAYNNRGAAYGAKGDLDRAVADFNEAIRLDPMDAQAFNQRCYALAIIGQAQQVLADCNGSLRLQLKCGQFDSAIGDYDSVLKLQSETASSLYGRGVAKLKKDDITGGIDIGRAKAIQADIAGQFARAGTVATE